MRSDNLKFKDIFWNTLGTVTYSFISLVFSIVIINISGSIEGGIFSFGFSTLAHLIFIITFFGIRPMHIVDVKYRYSFSDYKNFGIRAAISGIIFGLAYIAFRYFTGSYTAVKSLLLIILVIHGAIDGFADYYECEYQRVNKLYMSGQSLFFRIIVFATTLVISLIITKNLLTAEILAIFSEVIVFYFLNIKRSNGIYKIISSSESKVKSIFIESLPLFLITFLDMYIFAASKFAIDVHLGDVYSGFYNLIFMPTNVIYLIMTLIMKPILTPLSNAYYNDKVEYNKILLNTFLLSLVIAVVFILGTIFFGKIYLFIIGYLTNGIYDNLGKEIVFRGFSEELLVLLLVIIGGCFYTICTPMFYAIIIEKKQKYLLVAYGINLLIAFYISNIFVSNAGIIGAAISFVINMFILFSGVVIVKGIT